MYPGGGYPNSFGGGFGGYGNSYPSAGGYGGGYGGYGSNYPSTGLGTNMLGEQKFQNQDELKQFRQFPSILHDFELEM